MALSSLAPVNDWKGNAYPLQQETENKVVLVVNVASQCGFTVQYDALEKLYKKYKDSGLIIIGIPSNEFKQEKGTGESCRLRFGVTFPILEKSAVNGHDANPLIKYCKQQAPHLILGPGIIWNFEKFLLNRKGEVVARFPGFLQPSFLEGYVRRELGL
ncbi:thiol peroxidase that functions as a hydroperoxide receptor [Obelidium mucronatum]|nr:thiol peroxidase that functions as a hydroperoxide receptor [Obelidium mucronatum]